TSLLRDIAPLTDEQKTDYAPLDSPAALKKSLADAPRTSETAAWLVLDAQDEDEEGFGAHVLAVETSSEPGVARTTANDVDNKTLAAMKEWLAERKRPKIVHDPKLFHLLAPAEPARDAFGGIRHATMLYSYLLRPTTSNHALAETVLRHMNRTLSGAAKTSTRAPPRKFLAWRRSRKRPTTAAWPRSSISA
ncbi:MAG: hypothetical protein ACRETL_13590, partial [Gammaproteobacteria bacterium]